MTELRRETHTTVEHRWEWVEMYGPWPGDQRQWQVSISDRHVHIKLRAVRGQTQMTITASGTQNLIDALTEALAATTTEPSGARGGEPTSEGATPA